MHMKRTKFKTGILAVVFCSLTFLFSGDGNSIYADEILTDTELPVCRFSFEEKTEEADDEDYESVEEDDVAEQSLLRMTGISADDWEKYEVIIFMNSYRMRKKNTGMIWMPYVQNI